MITGWRICQKKYVKTAFSGEGAFRYGARWNSPGTRVVYLAGSMALAQLEVLVHVASADELGRPYVIIPAEFPEEIVQEHPRLPRNWKVLPAPSSLAVLGDEWAASLSSAVLRVPSVVAATAGAKEYNYLLNPAHPDWSKFKFGKAQTLKFDPRLKEVRT